MELARIAARRAQARHLQKFALLMVASQTGENRLLANWWLSWFDTAMPDCSSDERAVMPGFLTLTEIKLVKLAPPDQFDAVFVEMMIRHHRGAVKMADQMWHSRGDPRLRVMAHAIRHEQQGAIALMHGESGLAAVVTATRNMLGDNVN
ncbi:DUF305 domain-containing protein [Bradyrhizobium sp. CB2312]|uniref:DUF305 domain-containing protein n=1 Tax=Bradyrhizobium sp. CB2312 TaxID=3039155 RepID=UPI0024B04F14|nr:DUF305 domain-containing protein [Bradyrhizobium sp. CB2312]WFU76945.1 DUF305 domain-containing protein [Bradyrhizobium sp. CB2312]